MRKDQTHPSTPQHRAPPSHSQMEVEGIALEAQGVPGVVLHGALEALVVNRAQARHHRMVLCPLLAWKQGQGHHRRPLRQAAVQGRHSLQQEVVPSPRAGHQHREVGHPLPLGPSPLLDHPLTTIVLLGHQLVARVRGQGRPVLKCKGQGQTLLLEVRIEADHLHRHLRAIDQDLAVLQVRRVDLGQVLQRATEVGQGRQQALLPGVGPAVEAPPAREAGQGQAALLAVQGAGQDLDRHLAAGVAGVDLEARPTAELAVLQEVGQEVQTGVGLVVQLEVGREAR